jgi:hypothetical protein
MFPHRRLPHCPLMEWIPVFFNLYYKIHGETLYFGDYKVIYHRTKLY